jgi:ubiquinone/menaquinone biosynthesis C-methylase UbiE
MGPSLTAFVVVAAALPGFAQQFGPAENLGPAVPTPTSLVEKMLEAGRIKPGDVVYDLGSGDGRIVIAAARIYGVRAVGVEIVPDLCRKARERIQSEGLTDKIRIIEGSALRVDLSPADVITMFFMTDSNERLRPALERQLRPGTRVVSYQFPVRGWKAHETVHVKLGKSDYPIFVYEIGKTR